MTQAKAAGALDQVAGEFSEFTLEPYVVGPMGLGVFRLDVSPQVSAYVSFAYFAKYQSLGAYIGFAFPALKAITDECLLAVGQRLNVVPRYALANPCPAVLFPLEFFLPSPEAQPFKLAEPVGKWAKRVIYEKVLLGTHVWLKERRQLCEFLASDETPFSWSTAEVPRRLAHVVSLAHSLGEPVDVVERLVRPATRALPGDADFDGCDGGEFADVILRHFYGP